MAKSVTPVVLTVAGKSLSPPTTPCLNQHMLTPAARPAGCLGCSLLPLVEGVTIGDDYKGAPTADDYAISTHRMTGSGPSPCKVLIVMDAPSSREDSIGEIGESRDVVRIRAALRNANIKDGNYRITYAVRCHTPELREPVLRACNPYLAREIEKVNPDILVPVGATAMRAVVGKGYSVQQCAGQSFTQRVGTRDRQVMAVWSPGYVFVNDFAAGKWQEQFNTLAGMMEGTTKAKDGMGQYTRIHGAKEAADALDAIVDGMVSIDIETNCLDPREENVPAVEVVEIPGEVLRVLDKEERKLSMHFAGYTTMPGTPQPRAKISIVSWATKQGEASYVLRDHDDDAWGADDQRHFDLALASLLRRRTVRKVFWNAMFEFQWFFVHLGVAARNFRDAMIVHYLDAEERSHALDNAATEYTGMGNWKTAIDGIKRPFGNNYSQIPVKIIGPYAGADADAALRVYQAREGKLDKRRKILHNNFYPRLIPALARMQARGAKADKRAAILFEKYSHRLYKIEEGKIYSDTHVCRLTRKKNRLLAEDGKEPTYKLNLNSPPQLKTLLFEICEFEPFTYTSTGAPSTNKDTLTHFVKTYDSDLCACILKWRTYEKQHGTYAVGALDHIRRFNRYIRGNFRPAGTVTGRISSGGPNLQNQPNIGRRAYVSRHGRRGGILQFDMSQIEVRVSCSLANEETMLAAYRAGLDVHRITMMRMFSLDEVGAQALENDSPLEYKRKRTIAKRVVFGVLYGIGGEGIQRALRMESVIVSIDEAREYIDRFFGTYAAIDEYLHGQVVREVHRRGYALSPFGRRRHLPSIRSADEEQAARAKRQGPNAIIQSAASDMTLSALILIDEELRRRKMESMVIMTVHDSIVLDCVWAEAAAVYAIAKKYMERLPEFGKSIWGDDFDWSWLRCPIVADCEIGLNWRDGVKFDPEKMTLREAHRAAAKKQKEEDEKLFAEYENATGDSLRESFVFASEWESDEIDDNTKAPTVEEGAATIAAPPRVPEKKHANKKESRRCKVGERAQARKPHHDRGAWEAVSIFGP